MHFLEVPLICVQTRVSRRRNYNSSYNSISNGRMHKWTTKYWRRWSIFFNLQLLLHNGWPQQYNPVTENLKIYWSKKEEFRYYNIFVGQMLIAHKKMVTCVLSRLNWAHQGITSSRAKAKIAVYWPNIMKDIKNYTENCQICLEHQRANTKEPLMPY